VDFDDVTLTDRGAGNVPQGLTLAEAGAKWREENDDALTRATRAHALTLGTDESVTTRHQGLTESALSERFIERHEDELRYCAAWGKWLRWDGERWKVEQTLLAFDRAHLIARDAAFEAGDAARAKIASAHTVAAIQALARADRRIAATPEQWDRDPWLLNTPAGIIDLRSGRISANDPLQFMTRVTGCYVDPEGIAPLGALS
jgi:putative DNA primase/helicase